MSWSENTSISIADRERELVHEMALKHELTGYDTGDRLSVALVRFLDRNQTFMSLSAW